MDLCSLKLSNSQITKVTKDRIFSLTLAPVTDKVLVLAGDKWGKIGVWDTVSQSKHQLLVYVLYMCEVQNEHSTLIGHLWNMFLKFNHSIYTKLSSLP